MGKGSGRRPSQISEEEAQSNYDRTFRGPQIEKPSPCPATQEVNGYKVRCYETQEHVTHRASFDGIEIEWDSNEL
jgi:hypothetical protein